MKHIGFEGFDDGREHAFGFTFGGQVKSLGGGLFRFLIKDVECEGVHCTDHAWIVGHSDGLFRTVLTMSAHKGIIVGKVGVYDSGYFADWVGYVSTGSGYDISEWSSINAELDDGVLMCISQNGKGYSVNFTKDGRLVHHLDW